MKTDKGFEPIGDLFNKKQPVKSPAYEWQDLALQIIKELGVPGFKRNAVFKVCKENSKSFVERCLNDTRELCHGGQCWKYFFKVVGSEGKDTKPKS